MFHEANFLALAYTRGSRRLGAMRLTGGAWSMATTTLARASPSCHCGFSVKIFVASDHAGFHLRQRVLQHLQAHKHEIVDMGPASSERSDYPDFAGPLGRQVRDTPGAVGVLVCGSGLGMCMAANKVHGVRAADGFSIEAARLARSHNDANVICLGERLLAPDNAMAILDAFVSTRFEGGRHIQRIQKIRDLEQAEAHVNEKPAVGAS